MIAAIDVHYKRDASATAAAVVFSDFSDSEAYCTYTKNISGVKDYVPGQFYRRELPCIIAVLKSIEKKERIDTVVIDGYVELGGKPGLGQYLWKALKKKRKIIGVAKEYFRGSKAIKVYRGGSRRALFVTAAGIDPPLAADLISRMIGEHRLPKLLKLADTLSRRC